VGHAFFKICNPIEVIIKIKTCRYGLNGNNIKIAYTGSYRLL
jgi:LEA14-like dessication related protein